MQPPSAHLSLDLQQRIANRVACAWRRRGIKSYPYEDLYQDAIVIMHSAARNYDPTKGSLEGYLTRCCVYKVGDRLTRAIQPASARSNDDVINLRNLKTVRIKPSPSSVSESNPKWDVQNPDYDHMVWLTQVRERMLQVVDGDGLALSIALGQRDVKDIAETKDEARLLHQRVRKVKRRLQNDRGIYLLFKEVA